ncbi:glycosyltransferase [Candidatus Woesearchaeota archaeon]|nr:glycosyltransferase [Candidatus Woesearchaeota archaeon]
MPKISACLVVRNEEKLIGRALGSLKGVVDEIIVVHSGVCADRTLEIARKYTKKIFVAPDRGAGCYNRPFAFSKASGDWIIYIDGDEFLSDGLRTNIRKLAADDSVDGYGFRHEIMVSFRPLKKVGSRLCMFRKSRAGVRGFIHEAVRVRGRVRNVRFLLHHRPLYDNYTFRSFRLKWLRWAMIQARDMIGDGRAGLPGFMYFFVSVFVFFMVWFRDSLWHGIDNGFRGQKVAFLQALYNFVVYWNIFKLKVF